MDPRALLLSLPLPRPRLPCLRRLIAFGVIAAGTAAALPARAAITLALNPPIRQDKARTPTNTDYAAGNTGINHDNCVSNEQWTFAFTSLEQFGSFGALDVWGTTGTAATSCAPVASRSPAPTCFYITRFDRTAVTAGQQVIIYAPQMVSAAYGADASTTLDKATVLSICNRTALGTGDQPIKLTLHFFLTTGSGDIHLSQPGGTNGDGAESTWFTGVDVVGPQPPAISVLPANRYLALTWPSLGAVASGTSDLVGFQAYCYTDNVVNKPAGTKDVDAGDAVGTDAGDTGAIDDTGDGGDGGDATDGASADASDAAPKGTCPDGYAKAGFVAGTIPGPDMKAKYDCGLKGSISSSLNTNALDNYKNYAVAVSATDRYGNSGAFSNIVCSQPQETLDFYSVYRGAGGGAGGGYCAIGFGSGAVGGGFAVGLAAIAAAIRRRTSRRQRMSTKAAGSAS